ncbi:bifunctional diguanylate cyclase/phosphodiesterase [Chitinibacter sp. ZOR0017]|uniref:sensor domain-containing protein n=1 Tax=Chitinibacter sp. ZOR0017 TaxID=1339254 RepID=UPI00068C7193|nr:sensor domain-containing diguanylate cyclase [Chitinibacter sp. ZOR0017]
MIKLDQVPCPLAQCDGQGQLLSVNVALCQLTGQPAAQLVQLRLEQLLPPAGRIFLHTHLWPMLLRDGELREIYLKLLGPHGELIPVLANCQQTGSAERPQYCWVFFVAQERSAFEAELLDARQRVEAANLALADNERFLNTIANALPSLVAYVDRQLHYRFANQVYQDWFGCTSEAIIGSVILASPPFANEEAAIQAVLTGQAQQFERSLATDQHVLRHTLVNLTPDCNLLGEVIGFFVLVSDVSALKLAQADLQLAASVYEAASEGIVVTDAQLQIISVNPAFTRITGWPAPAALGCSMSALNPPDAPDHHPALLEAIQQHGQWAGESWYLRRDGHPFLAWQTVAALPGHESAAPRLVWMLNDITERWQKDERIRHLAFHDPLTNLPNRALTMERLEQLIISAQRQPKHIALLYLDLDGFKPINDQFGHDAGDWVLQQVALRLVAQTRSADTVARFGGDEFIVLLNHPMDALASSQIAERMIAAVNQALDWGGQALQVGVSIGIAQFPTHALRAAELLQAADQAMYVAKTAGKNTFRFARAPDTTVLQA